MKMSDLPGELVEEILCRIPATSLKQLRSTSKRWNRLFNDRRFTRKHFDKAAKQFLVLMLKECRVCSVSVNIYNFIPSSVEVRGELSLIDPQSSVDQFDIGQVFHCDGLLLCTDDHCAKVVVWNPCTGQTRWIQPSHSSKPGGIYVLGSYHDIKSGNISYKILKCKGFGKDKVFEIYEMNSNSWRILDVTLDYEFAYIDYGVSLKGNTYWFASDEKEFHLGIFLVCFDYETEKFRRQCIPCQCPRYETVALSVVREEKLSVLLQPDNTSRTEIWVTNKIDKTKAVSWSMVLAVDLKPELNIWLGVSFLVDEEKKVLVCCDKYFGHDGDNGKNMIYIVGEDNQVRQVDYGFESSWTFLFNYVPSLTQIQQGIEGKRRTAND